MRDHLTEVLKDTDAARATGSAVHGLRTNRHVAITAVIAVCIALLGGCGLINPYRYNISQGNYVTADAVKQVKPGMNREQVRQLLGSPLIADPFRTDRWDYVFLFRFASGQTDSRRATVFFANGLVTKVEATELPESESTDDPVLRRGRTA
jgi:outer membrane protein assembly factor BamE